MTWHFSPNYCPVCHLESCECVIHQGRFEEIKHLRDERDECELCWEKSHGSAIQSPFDLGARNRRPDADSAGDQGVRQKVAGDVEGVGRLLERARRMFR